MYSNDLLVVDLETTGLNPHVHRIIEMGIIQADGRTLKATAKHNVKIAVSDKARTLASPKAMEINGFDGRDWSDAIPMHKALDGLNKVGRGRIMVAHNVTFDWSFLQAAYWWHDLEPTLHYHRLCTMSMFKLLHPGERASLDVALQRYGLSPEQETHIAINGAEKCLELLGAMAVEAGTHTPPERPKF